MKHKRIASALLAAMIIVTSASNSIFPVSAKDLDVQNQEVSELSEEENDAIAEENEVQNDSQENDASENDQESSGNTENDSSESDQDNNGGADNGDAEPGQDGSDITNPDQNTNDGAGSDTTTPDQGSSDAADNNTTEPGQDTSDAADNNAAEPGQDTSDVVDNTTENPNQDATADTTADETVITDETTEEDAEEEPFEGVAEAAEAEYFDRYSWQPSGDAVALAAETGDDIDVTADIRKRAEWTNETNGDGRITLEYKATMGNKTALKDMNVVLVQDKSGSMDSNYGYNLEKVRQGWSKEPDKDVFYPARNFDPEDGTTVWTENVDTYLKKMSNYFDYLNTNLTGYPGFRRNGNDTYLTNGEMNYNSPCQVNDHYYLTIKEDTTSNIPAWTMVSGRSLYNISSTDLHHYIKLDNYDERLTYTRQGRRVVVINKGSTYYDETGKKIASEDIAFLDATHLDNYNGSWILSTCGEETCQRNDRLAKSQEFMTSIVDHIEELNPNNKIAYVPFWGDVPNNGRWENASANEANTGLVPPTGGNRLTQHDGVTKIDFTTSYNTIIDQINDSFTYDGTNWTRAFENTRAYVEAQKQKEPEKEILVIFLTDGMPQGTEGKPTDYTNPAINGGTKIDELKSLGATVYACGVGVNASDTTGLAERLDKIDSTQQAVYARTTDEFEALQETILARIDKQYKVDVKGENAFYTDALGENFYLDESKLDADNWAVFDRAEGTMRYNVPGNVYDAAVAGKKYIYIKEMNTVYWYIGDLTEGGYEVPGHEMDFPIKYKEYNTVTDGDVAMESNNEQKLTYTTTLGKEKSETMDPPQIIFNRQAKPSIEIVKDVTGANFTTRKAFRFVYSDQQYTSGKIEQILGETTVTVSPGQSRGTGAFTELTPGTYYVYEVDDDNNMISPTVGTVTVTEKAEITTEDKSPSVPASATASDDEELQNRDNVLRIVTTGGTVNFTNEYVKVNVSKNWDGDEKNTSLRPQKITIHLLRDGVELQTMELTAGNKWKGSFENLEKYDPTGKAYTYTITEDTVPGYDTTISDPTINGSEYSYTVTNTLLRGSITIQKKDGNGKDLEGATFELKNDAGEIIKTVTSGSDGKVEFKDLLPDTYTITETETPSGHMLLKDPITVTIPMKLTEQQVTDQKVDKDKCKVYTENGQNVYWVYDFTYEITNGMSFDIPIAGGVITVQMYVPLIAGMLLLCAVAVLLLRKKKDHSET